MSTLWPWRRAANASAPEQDCPAMTYIAKPTLHHPTLTRNKVGYTRRDYEGKVSTLCAGCGDSIAAVANFFCSRFML